MTEIGCGANASLHTACSWRSTGVVGGSITRSVVAVTCGFANALAVDLARGGQARQHREDFVRRGAHVIGQPFGDATLQPRHVDCLGGACDEKRGEKFRAIVVREQLHDSLRDAGPFTDHRLDLGEFDAEAADLHLRIDAADEMDVARRIQADEIAPTGRSARVGRTARRTESS